MKSLISLFLISLLFTCSNRIDLNENKTDSNIIQTRSTNIIFEDNFDQTSSKPDTTKWSLCPQDTPAWAKYLSESYDQAFVENGNLALLAEKVNGIYKVGGVWTKDKFSFQYGRIEVRARFAKTVKGGWPAIWMMPQSPKYNEGWPTCGEIDIMEQLNHDLIVHHTIHSNYKNNLHLYVPLPSLISFYKKNEYNTYAVEWSKDSITFLVNGQKKLTYPNMNLNDESLKKQWPFDAPFFLILNYALGGENTWPGIIDDSQLPGKMEIDWVRVYQ